MTTDPPRLLEQSSTGLASALIAAGRDDAPSETALRRTLLSVGASAAVLTASSAAAGAAGAAGSAIVKSGAGTTSLGLAVKWLGIGTVGGLVTAATAYQLAPPVGGLGVEPAAQVVVVSAAPRPKRAPPAPPALAPAGDAPEQVVAVLESVDPPPRRTAGAAPLGSSVAPEPVAPLAAEVAFVDSARTAFQAGNLAGTLERLARYEAEFPGQRLHAEVLFLRMEAHGGLGDRVAAEAVARRVLAAYPKSPHAARARSVLGQAREKVIAPNGMRGLPEGG
jgi:hypothetical protein